MPCRRRSILPAEDRDERLKDARERARGADEFGTRVGGGQEE